MDSHKDNTNDSSKSKRRITQACILCRKKKIKCDGTKPECLHCQESDLQCQYTEYKKRGPHKGYVRILEERLAQLEQSLKNAGEEVPPPISHTSPSSSSHISRIGQEQSSLVTNDDDFPPTEIVKHLIDLFFRYINSVFPLVHSVRLKNSMQDGTVSKPLLWALMAISARFSDHPNIKTNPPYWAGERFAHRATSSIDSQMLEPTIPNLQFWGIMSCLEYGRASGSKAWLYGGVAAKMCQELGFNKEATLRSPVYRADGTIDCVAMALHRRIFWSCLCIDKFASTSTNRPQGFGFGDYDSKPPSLAESQILCDGIPSYTLEGQVITSDPLMDVIPLYLRTIERFGQVLKCVSRANKTADLSSVQWPPIPEFNELDTLMQNWRNTIPEPFQFSPALLRHYKETSCQNYLNFWLCSHAMYCTSMLALHRGSLAYNDLTAAELPVDVYERIQNSIRICKVTVDIAIEVFKELHDICGCNLLPYMGYSAYIFSTVLMTPAFSSDPASYSKSSSGLAVLFDTIKILRPYWPMSERLVITTRDMLAAHSRLYEVQEQERSINHEVKKPTSYARPDIKSLISASASDAINSPAADIKPTRLEYTSYLNNSNSNNSGIIPVNNVRSATNTIIPPSHQPLLSPHQQPPVLSPNSQQTTTLSPHQQPMISPNHQNSTNSSLQQQSLLSSHLQQPTMMTNYQTQPFQGPNDSVFDFNSFEFLYDSELFGQIIFDTSKPMNDAMSLGNVLQQQPPYTTLLNNGNQMSAMYQ